MWLRARLLEIVEDVRASYWFVPALIALTGFATGLLLVWIDATIGDAWLGRFEWFYGSRPAGARELLSTVAGSTITVAGVVFSVTLAAVTYASGQYGPRLLSNFMRDRGNQATLGIFIGTFLYCLVVLRTIRSAEEASADTAGAVREAFVPHVAMFGALALAILSIGILIYFVHHVTDGIHINNVIARIGQSLLDDIDDRAGEGDHDDDPARPEDVPDGVAVLADKTGYVEAIDQVGLMKLAVRRDLVLRLAVLPGDFVHRGQPVLFSSPETDPKDGCADLFNIGRKRSAQQDLRFPIDELVEIAARALSPGVNDPFTAIACIDWLGAALISLAAMPSEPERLRDDEGQVRLVVRRLRFEDFMESAVGQMRDYAAADANAARRLDDMLHRLADASGEPRIRSLVSDERLRLRKEVTRRGQSEAG